MLQIKPVSGTIGIVTFFGVSIVCQLCFATPSAQSKDAFRDVPTGHWAYAAVLELKRLGILEGYPDTASRAAHGAPKRSKYDLSTPLNAWKSFMLALESGDEAGLKMVLSPACFSARESYDFKFEAISEDHAIRQSTYKERGALWAKRTLVLDTPLQGDSVGSWQAMLVDFGGGPDAPGHWILVALNRIGGHWRITKLMAY